MVGLKKCMYESGTGMEIPRILTVRLVASLHEELGDYALFCDLLLLVILPVILQEMCRQQLADSNKDAKSSTFHSVKLLYQHFFFVSSVGICDFADWNSHE